MSTNNKLYVGNVSFQMNDETLEKTFSEFGTVKSAKVIMDFQTGRSRGFAFVEMETDSEAQNCIQNLDGKEIDGRALKVNIAKERSDGPRDDRGGRNNRRDRGNY